MADGLLSVAAHTIGHRNIVINNQESEGDNDNDNSNINNVYVGNSFCNTSTVSGIEVSPGDVNYRTVESLNSTETEAEPFNDRTLVVVVVRGSVTPLDWLTDY